MTKNRSTEERRRVQLDHGGVALLRSANPAVTESRETASQLMQSLSRVVLVDSLRHAYGTVVEEPLPESFLDLLNQIDEKNADAGEAG